jgi:hypothetical protein
MVDECLRQEMKVFFRHATAHINLLPLGKEPFFQPFDYLPAVRRGKAKDRADGQGVFQGRQPAAVHAHAQRQIAGHPRSHVGLGNDIVSR